MKNAFWPGAAVVGCLAAGSVAAGLLAGIPVAHAADAHQPFAQDAAAALIARPDASGAEQLYKRDLTDDTAMEKVGGAWQGNGRTKQYNALGFNKTDGYAYAVSGQFSDSTDRRLLQIGSDGSVVDLGPLLGDTPADSEFVNNGTIVDGRHLLVSTFNGNVLYSVDLTTRVTTATTLDRTWTANDFVSAGDTDLLWGFEEKSAFRLDTRTGAIEEFANPQLSFVGGAIFAYPNGDLGLSADSGTLYRLRIAGAASASPSFSVVAKSAAPASDAADATAILENADVFRPFDKDKPFGLWASSDPSASGTQLHTVDPTQPGAPSTPLGTPWAGNGRVDTYNAIAYNQADGFVYAITGDNAKADNRLVKISRDGAVREIGPLTHAVQGWRAGNFFNNGTIVDGKLLIAAQGTRWLISVDLETAKYTQIDTSDVWQSADMTTNDGVYLWGVFGGTIQRMEIATGTVTNFPNTIIPASAREGGIMNGSDGDFIVSSNGSLDGSTQGTVYRIHVTDPGSAAPTFALVAKGTGPVSGDNDGTSNLDVR